MKNKLILSMILLSLLVLSSFSVMAFMPKGSHRIIFEQSLSDSMTSNMYVDCMKHKDLCYAGNVLTDVTVITYYTNKGLYGLTHSPQFCSTMLDNVAKVPNSDPERMMACAVGACMHQPADIASHSRQNKDGTGEDGLVPYSIKHSFIVNEVIHVFAEQKVDNEILAKYPELEQSSITYLQDNYKECQPLFELSMMGLDSSVSANELNDLFATFIDETLNYQGYKPAYEQKSFMGTFSVLPMSYIAIFFVLLSGFALIFVLLVMKIIRKQAIIRHYIGLVLFGFLLGIMVYLAIGAVYGSAFNNFLNLINPVVKFVPTGNTDTYINLGITNTKGLLAASEGWLDNTDASGRGQIPVLDEANAVVQLPDLIMLGVLILALLGFIWFLFRKNKVITKSGGFSL